MLWVVHPAPPSRMKSVMAKALWLGSNSLQKPQTPSSPIFPPCCKPAVHTRPGGVIQGHEVTPGIEARPPKALPVSSSLLQGCFKNPEIVSWKSFTPYSHICLLSLSNHTPTGLSNWDSSNGSWRNPYLLIRVLQFPIKAPILPPAFTKLFTALAA